MSKIVLPENVSVLLKLGDAYYSINSKVKAIENYKMVLKLDENNVYAKLKLEELKKNF